MTLVGATLDSLPEELLLQLKAVTVLEAADRLIFQFDHELTQLQAEEIKDKIKIALGDDLRFLVTGKDIDTYVIKAVN